MESELFKTDIDGPPNPASFPFWLAHSLAPARGQAVARRTTRLLGIRIAYVRGFERMAETLQFKNERSALRPDTVATRLAGRAPCDPVVILWAISGSHG
jgi:hypothetical protein